MAWLRCSSRLFATAYSTAYPRILRLRPARFYSTPGRKADIESLLAKPTWSVRSLLPDQGAESSSPSVRPEQLRHLLRLSALPQPSSQAEEKEMLETLESQIHFVKQVQSVDATDIEPLQCIRDESPDAVNERTIGVDRLQGAMCKERVFGRRKRIQRVESEKNDRPDGDAWDGNALGHASKTKGRYFVVETGN
ncbi:hypothetical protein PHISP_05555 [Aspergillus sp. HF37]|nr:hypothetical protein PHISP_05555 [Aspergillus sp. HF37]